MRTTIRSLVITGLLVGATTVAGAQAPARQGPPADRPMPRGAGITEILNARRALDLTPRQVAQLDSIERTLWAERQKTQAAMRERQEGMRQEMRQRIERGERPGADPAARDSLRASMQARMQEMRPQMEQLRRRDSTARAAADRILNDTQRQKLREMDAERRGFERGMRAGRAGGRGDMRGNMRGNVRGGVRGGARAGGRPGPGADRAGPPAAGRMRRAPEPQAGAQAPRRNPPA